MVLEKQERLILESQGNWGRTSDQKGEIIRKVKEDELLDALRNELEHWGE